MSILVSAVFACFASDPGLEAHIPSQAAADILRQVTEADAAFLPAAAVKSSFEEDNLASLLQFPADELAVVKLKGSHIRQALERSVSLYPNSNAGFLQLSGIEAVFSKTAPTDKRIVSLQIGGIKLDDSKQYLVAMPASLARGALGYFRVWERSQIVKDNIGRNLETILKGKKLVPSTPRWTASS